MAASGLYAQLGVLSAHLSKTENRHLGQKYDRLINPKACPPVMYEAPPPKGPTISQKTGYQLRTMCSTHKSREDILH